MKANTSAHKLLLVSNVLSWSATHGFWYSTSPLAPLGRGSSLGVQEAPVSSHWTDGGKVEVRVVQDLPYVEDPSEALDAWMEHHWTKGGGLPILVRNRLHMEDHTSTCNKRIRSIFPTFMEEVVYRVQEANPSSRTLKYRVSNPGPLFAPHLVPDSHDGMVCFAPANEGAARGFTMTWAVEFETKRYQFLYQALTEFTVGTAARTVAESLSAPRLLTLKATLRGQSDPVEARRTWLEFFWARGGGLPLPPPMPYGDVLKDGGGTARKNNLRIPPLLTETVLSLSTTSEKVDAVYQLKYPGWTTFPFLMHTHIGRAQFFPLGDAEGVGLVWEVQIRSFPLVATIVEKLVEMTVSTIVRNLAVHVAHPGAEVTIKGPRGQSIIADVDSFGSVPKDCWLGGVLDAHLHDNRSSLEQALSLVQPWTWGRSGSGDEKDYVTFTWSNGQMS